MNGWQLAYPFCAWLYACGRSVACAALWTTVLAAAAKYQWRKRHCTGCLLFSMALLPAAASHCCAKRTVMSTAANCCCVRLQVAEKEAVADGKKPFFLKKSEKRKRELVAKYEELKSSGRLDKYMEKRRKKNAAKDHRYVPSTRRQD